MDIDIKDYKPVGLGPKRILINVPEELHHKVKTEASLRNISIRKWLIRVIINELTRLESYK